MTSEQTFLTLTVPPQRRAIKGIALICLPLIFFPIMVAWLFGKAPWEFWFIFPLPAAIILSLVRIWDVSTDFNQISLSESILTIARTSKYFKKSKQFLLGEIVEVIATWQPTKGGEIKRLEIKLTNRETVKIDHHFSREDLKPFFNRIASDTLEIRIKDLYYNPFKIQ